VLQGPPDVAVFECACRDMRGGNCQPSQVCMIIGQPIVDFIVEHHSETSRRLTTVEALDILRAEHERGHVHTAYFKDACLDRFYAICNCCECCCAGIEAMIRYEMPVMASSGYVARVNETLCTGCGTCEGACAFEAVQVDGTASVIWEACMGCGVCVAQCPHEARSLVRDETKGLPLDVRLLVQEQAVS
jgi:TPP-dependent indolepyruvate ferredoxin oxidoreductase alpha subunit